MTVAYPAQVTQVPLTSPLNTLIEAGAFDAFCHGNRQSLLNSIEELSQITKKYKEQKVKVMCRKQEAEALETADDIDYKTLKKAMNSVKSAENAMQKYKALFDEYVFLVVPEDAKDKLNREYELLGAYITGNPLDEYEESMREVPNITLIEDVSKEGEKISICGMVTGLRILQRKSDGRQFCTMKVFDKTGEIEVKVFTKEFEKFGDLIAEGAVLIVNGKTKLEDSFDSEEAAVVFQAIEIKKLQVVRRERFIITAPTIADWYNNYEAILAYRQDDGYELRFHDMMEQKVRICDFRVSKDILDLSIPNLVVSQA